MGILVENRSASSDIIGFFDNTFTNGVPVLGAIIDTVEFPQGVTFAPTRVGSNIVVVVFTFTIDESDDSGMAGATPISADRMTGALSDIELANNNNEGDFLNAIGVFNTLRFIRMSVTSDEDTDSEFTVMAYVRATNRDKAVVNDVIVV